MSTQQVPRNDPCPCGSGQKYKKCCLGKSFDWEVNTETGAQSRRIPLSPEALSVIASQKQKFVEKFGREPGPNDKLFFDAPPTEHLEAKIVQAMEAAGTPPEFVYAFEKTNGLLVTDANKHLIPEADLKAWFDAVAEYRKLHPSTEGVPAVRLGDMSIELWRERYGEAAHKAGFDLEEFPVGYTHVCAADGLVGPGDDIGQVDEDTLDKVIAMALTGDEKAVMALYLDGRPIGFPHTLPD